MILYVFILKNRGFYSMCGTHCVRYKDLYIVKELVKMFFRNILYKNDYDFINLNFPWEDFWFWAWQFKIICEPVSYCLDVLPDNLIIV